MNDIEAADIYREVLIIKKDVESIKHQTSWLLRGQASAVAGHWEKLFGILPGKKRRYNMMKVYLQTDGRRSVRQVAAAAGVRENETGELLAELERNKLVGLLPQKKTDKIYERSPVDFALGISDKLSAELEERQTKGKGTDE